MDTVAQIIRLQLAVSDLAEIYSYIAEDSIDMAEKFSSLLEEKITLLAYFPNMGFEVDFLDPGFRCYPFQNYNVFYTYDGEYIKIFRILHCSRRVTI